MELANSLSALPFRTKASVFINGLIHSKDVEIVPSSSALFSSAFELYRDRPDKEWGLVDCTSFLVMQQRGVSEVFTYDRHFEQAGFVALA